MENCQADHATNEFEVVEMFGVDARMRIDLESVVVVRRVFEQTVKGIEHFMRKQKEKLSVQKVNDCIVHGERANVAHTGKDHRNLNHPRRRI